MEKLNEYVEAQKFLETLDWDNIPDSDEPLASICEALQDIQNYKDLEEQGLLLRLPCKVGDTVYKPNPITLSEIVEIKIESIFITESKINISGRTTKMKYSFCCSPSDLGKTVFLTKEEAEQKLKEMEVNEDLER